MQIYVRKNKKRERYEMRLTLLLILDEKEAYREVLGGSDGGRPVVAWYFWLFSLYKTKGGFNFFSSYFYLSNSLLHPLDSFGFDDFN